MDKIISQGKKVFSVFGKTYTAAVGSYHGIWGIGLIDKENNCFSFSGYPVRKLDDIYLKALQIIEEKEVFDCNSLSHSLQEAEGIVKL